MKIVLGLLLVFLFVAVSVGGLVLVQRLIPIERRLEHNDVAGFIYAVLGVTYAVLLGLMLVAVWQDWQAAQTSETQEANELAAVFWLAHGLPQPEGRHIQELARSYARVEVTKEWPLMQHGKTSPKPYELLDGMKASVEAIHPTDEAQAALYSNELERLHELGDARRERLLEAEQGLPAILWAVLLVGGVITVGFTYLFGLRSTTVHVLMVAALALVIGLVLFTVASLDFPFRGDVRIGSEAFEQVLGRFEHSKLSDLR
jgi:uncharacterized membrane protein YraQ (UPF0718 family)